MNLSTGSNRIPFRDVLSSDDSDDSPGTEGHHITIDALLQHSKIATSNLRTHQHVAWATKKPLRNHGGKNRRKNNRKLMENGRLYIIYIYMILFQTMGVQISQEMIFWKELFTVKQCCKKS